MEIALEQNEVSSVILLEGVIDIASGADLKKLLLQAFESGKDIRIGLERVSGLDVTAVQLLWAARRRATASGVGFAIVGRLPELVTSALLEAGLEDFAETMDGVPASGVTPCQL